MQTLTISQQVSAGGVAFRKSAGLVEIALISVGDAHRWQLPKGTINQDETTETAALREVREEAGITTQLVAPLDTIDYWFASGAGSRRKRFHKYVHFFLMLYCSGDPADHDHEVNEARWVEIDQAIGMLAFEGEKRVVQKAREMIQVGMAESGCSSIAD